MPSLDNSLWLLLAIGVSYVCAFAMPLLGGWSKGRYLRPAVVAAVIGCTAAPLIIPAECVGLRAVAMLVTVELVFKMIDFVRERRRTWDGNAARKYCWFLAPLPALAIVYPDHKRRLAQADRPGPHVVRILCGAACIGVGIVLLQWLETIPGVQAHFTLDHILRVSLFIPAIEAVSQILYGVERLAGYETRPIVQNVFLSRTVFEFWQRYNYRVHDWLFRNIFQPSGGRRAPVRSLLLVFLFSGLFHEIGFGVATSRWTGYQFAFFAVQGPAVLITRSLDRWAKRLGIAGDLFMHGVTIMFLTVTSVLFFDGVCHVFPTLLVNGSPLR